MAETEVRIALLERRLDDLVGLVAGDTSHAYERSLLGRLIEVERTLSAADHLADAARELRRAESRKWSHREKVWLFAFAGMAAVGGLTGGIAAAVALLA